MEFQVDTNRQQPKLRADLVVTVSTIHLLRGGYIWKLTFELTATSSEFTAHVKLEYEKNLSDKTCPRESDSERISQDLGIIYSEVMSSLY